MMTAAVAAVVVMCHIEHILIKFQHITERREEESAAFVVLCILVFVVVVVVCNLQIIIITQPVAVSLASCVYEPILQKKAVASRLSPSDSFINSKLNANIRSSRLLILA